ATELSTSWLASPVVVSCTGPTDTSGHLWTEPVFDETGSGWTSVTMPDFPGVSSAADRFYRGHFALSAPLPSDAKLFFRCDDSCEAWINNTHLGSFGPGCHGICPCVNLPGCGCNQCVPPILLDPSTLMVGNNVVAGHLSNGTG